MLKRSLQTVIRNICLKGESLLDQGRLAEALEVFEEAKKYCANVPSIHILIADVLIRMERFKEAIDILNHAQELFELGPQEAVFESEEELLGKARKAYFNGEASCASILGDAWKNPKICYLLAICWKNLGEIEKGWEFLKRASKELFDGPGDFSGPHQELLFSGTASLDGPENILNNVEVFEAAGMLAEAFNLLRPQVYEKIVANDKVKSKAAGR